MTGPLPLRPRSAAALALASLVGLAGFGWPFLVDPGAELAHGQDATWLFAALLPLLLLVVLAELAEGGMDAKRVALLGLLAAVGAGLRVLGTGTAGVEPMFVLLVLAGYALGPGFGFALGCTALLASAFVTAGVGPWLPFQMFGAGWVALGAGLLPRVPPRLERWLLAGYGLLAGLLYGALLNLYFWPFSTMYGDGLSYVAGDPLGDNVVRYAAFYLATSLGWDLSRGLVTALLCLLAARPVLAALRRAARRAAFDARPTFTDAPA